MQTQEALDSGLDWLTLIGNDREAHEQLYADMTLWMKEEADKFEIKRFSVAGFMGMSCGALKFGFNRKDDRWMIQISGRAADHGVERLPGITSIRASRCDYQITIRYGSNLAKEIFDHLADENKKRIRQRTIHYHENNDGATVYVGKRSSGVFLRIYDKSAAYGEGKDIWRIEAEYKKKYASRAWDRWLSSSDRTGVIIATLQAELEQRGITQVWFGLADATRIKVVEEASDYEKKLLWLETTIRPAVGRLINAGYEEEVKEILWYHR